MPPQPVAGNDEQPEGIAVPLQPVAGHGGEPAGIEMPPQPVAGNDEQTAGIAMPQPPIKPCSPTFGDQMTSLMSLSVCPDYRQINPTTQSAATH